MSNSQALYGKLSDLAQKHASFIYRNRNTPRGQHKLGRMPTTRRCKQTQFSDSSFIVIDSDYQETIRILGEGDDEAVCLRIHWYVDNFPSISEEINK